MKLRIGTRGSKLALWQAHRVAECLATKHPDIDTEIIPIDSSGDRNRISSLADLGTVGIFTREIEAALDDKRTDIAVHSLKDMPTESPANLCVAALLPRDDPRDVLVAPVLAGHDPAEGHAALLALPRGATVGTSSLRRRAELLRTRSDLRIEDIRGNVPTRLRMLEENKLEAIVLSLAGLTRMGLEPAGAIPVPPEQMLPAAAQGTIAIQVRQDDAATRQYVAALDDPTTRLVTDTERLLLHHLEGGCRIPLGALAVLDGKTLTLRGRLTSPDGQTVLENRAQAPPEDWRDLAQRVATALRANGGNELLEMVRGL